MKDKINAVPVRRRSRVSRMIIVVLFVIGLALLGVMIGRVGGEGLREGFRAIGPWLFPYLLLEAVPLVLHTCGWAACFPGRRLPLPFWRLLLIRLAGSSIDEVTPTAMIGGEVVKVLAEMEFGSMEVAGEEGSAMLFDPLKCIRCGMCAQKCPTGACKMTENSFEDCYA